MKKSVTDLARGRWKGILEKFGINPKVLDGRHHPCPVTGEGDDRFRFSNKNGKGTFFCGCNDGRSDGFNLLKCKTGQEFKELAPQVEEMIGGIEEEAETDKKTPERALRDLRAVESSIDKGKYPTEMLKYLGSRGFNVNEVPLTLRYAKANYGLAAINITKKMDAMVAKFVDHQGKPVTLHLTYLEDGKKADMSRSRIIMTPAAPMAGGSVRLLPMQEDGILGIAEGIETALSAGVLFDMPVWSCLNAAMLEAFIPPDGCKDLTIFADNDANYTGQAAAYKAAHRISMRRPEIKVRVTFPPKNGEDFNDILRSRRNGS